MWCVVCELQALLPHTSHLIPLLQLSTQNLQLTPVPVAKDNENFPIPK